MLPFLGSRINGNQDLEAEIESEKNNLLPFLGSRINGNQYLETSKIALDIACYLSWVVELMETFVGLTAQT